MSAVSQYISDIQKVLQSGDSREHPYRPAFQRLTESLAPDVQIINELAYTGGNVPYFLFEKRYAIQSPIGVLVMYTKAFFHSIRVMILSKLYLRHSFVKVMTEIPSPSPNRFEYWTYTKTDNVHYI